MLSWFTGLFGVSGVLQAALSSLTALTNFLSNALTFLSPVLVKSLEGATWFLKTIWEGLKDIFDNPATIITVAAMVVGTWFYVKVPAEVKQFQCKQEVKIVKQQCKPQVIYKTRPAPQQPEFRFPWE